MRNQKEVQVIGILDIQRRIMPVRGVQVMLDRDLAALYGVETRALNQAVRRNIGRFPEDFMFQLSKEDCLRSQIVTLNEARGKHLKYLPYAFFSLSTTSSCMALARPSTALAVASRPTPPATRRRSPSCWQWCHKRRWRIETQTP